MNPAGLRVEEVTVRFGGVVAVDEVSLEVPMRSLIGLIGPNGAGKTTIFNACSGFIAPRSGRILLHGRDITHTGPGGRARRGLGRTFQRMELFDSLNVAANVALGLEASLAGVNPFRHVVPRRRDAELLHERLDDAVERTGIRHLIDRRVGDLSTGQRRLVELARAFAARFDVLLLDEPSSGLDVAESRAFGEILSKYVAEVGAAILLVEHDMELVMSVCQSIYVLDFGRVLLSGTPAEVRSSAEVRDAYLGSGLTC